jgi:uncharacterized protein with ParB-like and HNH nuclease domain
LPDHIYHSFTTLEIFRAIKILDSQGSFLISHPYTPINQEYLSGFSECLGLNDLNSHYYRSYRKSIFQG